MSQDQTLQDTFPSARASNAPRLEGSQQELVECLLDTTLDEWKMVSILCLIEEKSTTVVTDELRLEGLLGSLRAVFDHHMTNQCFVVVQQVCVTITSVLIGNDHYLGNPTKYAHGLVILLLSTLEKMKSAGQVELEGTLCLCLEELQIAYPGLLSESIMAFYTVLTSEPSSAFQHYMWLLSACIKHNKGQDVHPFPYESPFQLLNLPVKERETVSERQYSQIISTILDHMPLAAVCCRARIMTEIAHLMKRAAPIKVFYFQNKNVLSCFDVVLFHSALLAFLLSGQEMSEIEQDCQLGTKLVGLSLYSGFSAEENLLLTEWIYNLLTNSLSKGGSWSLPFSLIYSSYLCFPTVLDSAELSVAKLKLLSHALSSERQSSSGVTTLFMRCLTRLQRLIDNGVNIQTGASLYRTLYLLFGSSRVVESGDATNVSKQGTKLLLTISVIYPRFIPCTLNFISTLNKARQSSVPTDVLMSMLHQLNVTREIPYLEYYLMVIQQAAQLGIPEDFLIGILLKIVKTSNVCEAGDWPLGNYLLFTCQAVMVRVGKGQQFQDMDAVLMEIANSYNDPDISDRAWFYHKLIHTLSSHKLRQVLNLDSEGSNLSQIVEAEISGTSSTAEMREALKSNVLILSREFGESAVCKQMSRSVKSADSQNLQQYRDQYSTAQVTITIKCFLRYLPENEESLADHSNIFAVNLKFFTVAKDSVNTIPDVFLPKLNASEGPVAFRLTFCPDYPLPTSLHARATFCGSDGSVFTASLNTIEVQFTDYFALPQLCTSFTGIPLENLFSMLWTSIQDNQFSGVSGDRKLLGAVSQFNMSIPWQQAQHIAAQRLGQFLVSNEEGHLKLLILLPNRFHLLLEWLRSEEDHGVVVRVASDIWFTLQHVPQWLRTLQDE